MGLDDIKIIKNFLSLEDAQRVINYINDSIATAVDWLSDGSTPNFVYRPDRWYKRRMGLDDLMPNYSPERSISNLREVEGLIKGIVENARVEIGKAFNDQDKLYLNSLWLTKHLIDDSLTLHSDTGSGYNPQFYYSSILYLNTVDDGGELYFPNLDLYVKPSVGDLVAFPAHGVLMEHEILVTGQERFTIPMWFTKDPTQEVQFV